MERTFKVTIEGDKAVVDDVVQSLEVYLEYLLNGCTSATNGIPCKLLVEVRYERLP